MVTVFRSKLDGKLIAMGSSAGTPAQPRYNWLHG
jgi:hypothetical protein